MRKTGDLRTELLRHFYDKGYSLREAMHPLRLGYRPTVLAKLCRQTGIWFRDLDEAEQGGKALKKSQQAA